MFSVVLVILCFALDLAASCKPVTYEYTQFGVKYYGYGASKSCMGDGYEKKDTKPAPSDYKVWGCSEIKKGADLSSKGGPDLTGYDDEDVEDVCNWGGSETCIWKGGKCTAGSCPGLVTKFNCGGQFKNGKCEKLTGENCTYGDDGYEPTPGNANCNSGAYQCPNGNCRQDGSGADTKYYCRVYDIPCGNLTKHCQETYDYDLGRSVFKAFSSDDQKVCEYRCEHPPYYNSYGGPYQYTVPQRKYCHKQLGCLYAGERCSAWSIWAYVLTLVVLILVVVGGVGFVIVAHFVLKLF